MGISNNVAIIGVGCTKFGEHFNKNLNDLMVEAVDEAIEDAGIKKNEIEAGWYGNCFPEATGNGMSGSAMGDPVGFSDIPITRIENQCCTGMDAFRNACLGVASGEFNIAIAVGAEKMRDVKTSESLNATIIDSFHPFNMKGFSSPGLFAMYGNRVFHEFNIDKSTLAKIAVKNHKNAMDNPKAHLHKEVTVKDVVVAPIISSPLGLIDCCPVTDGSAAAIVTTVETAQKMGSDYVIVKGIGMANRYWLDSYAQPGRTFTEIEVTKVAAKIAYEKAGITNPIEEIDLAEVHDCFTITEILNMCDLGFCSMNEISEFIDKGVFEKDGKLPVNLSGGLNCCGHPIGATGLRMINDITNQILGRAGEMQIDGVKTALAHNLGGPGALCTITILGKSS